jgi:hypothetical protein
LAYIGERSNKIAENRRETTMPGGKKKALSKGGVVVQAV